LGFAVRNIDDPTVVNAAGAGLAVVVFADELLIKYDVDGMSVGGVEPVSVVVADTVVVTSDGLLPGDCVAAGAFVPVSVAKTAKSQ
jgi:hypothetical protein